VRRLYAILVSVFVLGAVVLPVRENLRQKPEDDFPLSYYPMFSHEHPEVQAFTYVLGIDGGGHSRIIPHRFWGTGGLNQARKQLRRIVNAGRGSARDHCAQIAARIAGRKEFDGVVRIAIVTDRYRPAEYFAGKTEPLSRVVHAKLAFERAAPLQDDDFAGWIREYLRTRVWTPRAPERSLTRAVLEESLAQGRRYLIANQKPDGNFNYEYNFVSRVMTRGDSPVRQAGAVWGLALMHRHSPDEETHAALAKSLAFFLKHSRPGPVEGSRVIAYPGEPRCQTGTLALVALALIETLRGDRDQPEYARALDGYLRTIEWLQRDDHHFADAFDLKRGVRSKKANPYADGESLLCLIKAAKYLGMKRLVPRIEDTALVLARRYTMDVWARAPDSSSTKGFFQWSCMALWEYQDAGWRDAGTAADYVLALTWWMIHTHRTLDRRRNTAYAYEGIIHGYRIARARGHAHAVEEIAWTIDVGLEKLTGWQVGGPLADSNAYLRKYGTTDPLAVGGVMNARNMAPLRIDVTQHQMHSVILALEQVYK